MDTDIQTEDQERDPLVSRARGAPISIGKWSVIVEQHVTEPAFKFLERSLMLAALTAAAELTKSPLLATVTLVYGLLLATSIVRPVGALDFGVLQNPPRRMRGRIGLLAVYGVVAFVVVTGVQLLFLSLFNTALASLAHALR